MRVFIVIFGNLGHGKDALADRLATHLAPPRFVNFHRTAFAAALKEAVGAFIGVEHRHLYGTQEEKAEPVYYGRSARYYLQWLGTEVGRQQVDPNLWVHRCIDNSLASRKDYVVVSDGRFWNELEEPKCYLGDQARVINILVHRPGLPDPKGRMPTRGWRFVRWLCSWVGVDIPLIHMSESEVLEMRSRHLSGEKLFDHVVINDWGLDLLDERAAQIAKKVKLVAGT